MSDSSSKAFAGCMDTVSFLRLIQWNSDKKAIHAVELDDDLEALNQGTDAQQLSGPIVPHVGQWHNAAHAALDKFMQMSGS